MLELIENLIKWIAKLIILTILLGVASYLVENPGPLLLIPVYILKSMLTINLTQNERG